MYLTPYLISILVSHGIGSLSISFDNFPVAQSSVLVNLYAADKASLVLFLATNNHPSQYCIKSFGLNHAASTASSTRLTSSTVDMSATTILSSLGSSIQFSCNFFKA
jgi:hypothetical protein